MAPSPCSFIIRISQIKDTKSHMLTTKKARHTHIPDMVDALLDQTVCPSDQSVCGKYDSSFLLVSIGPSVCVRTGRKKEREKKVSVLVMC